MKKYKATVSLLRQQVALRSLAAGMLLPALLAVHSQASAQLRFEDVTEESLGIFRSETWGVSIGDYNGDMWPDVFVGNHRDRPSFYRNNGDGTFTDVILQIDLDKMWLDNRYHDHHGAAFADVDGDGFDDLHVSTNGASDANFAESDGNFVRNRASSRLLSDDGAGWSVAFLDHNKDGRIDISRLSFNDSDLRTQDSAGRFGSGPGIDCSNNNYGQLGDITGDGFLDFLCVREGNFPQRVYDISNGFPRTVSTNNGLLIGNTLDTLIADLDGDLNNEILAVRGAIFPNQAKVTGPGRGEAFLDAASGQGSARYTFNASGPVTFTLNGRGVTPTPITINPGSSRSISAGGIGGDGVLSVTSTSSGSWSATLSSGRWASAYIIMTASSISNMQADASSLRAVDFPIVPRLLNREGGNWVNRTSEFGFRYEESCAGVVAADFDNDMDLDVYMSCRGGVENIANRVYKNDGNGVFGRISNFGGEGAVGAGLNSNAGTSENVVTLDYDNDGFMDVFVTNGLNDMPLRVGGPHQLLRNTGNSNNWIQIKLVGRSSSAPAIGARVRATAGGKTQLREQNGGFHRWSQNDQRIHFGLAGNNTVDLLIDWPNGQSQSFNNVQANRFYRVVEGQGITAVTPPSARKLPAATGGDECGSPTYINTADRALFLYKSSCGSSRWSVRLLGGQPGAAPVKGRIVELSGGSLSNVTRNNLESDDIVALGSDQLDFTLGVGPGGLDGFDINVSGDACFIVERPSDIRSLLGSRHVEAPSPGFNLRTMQACSIDFDGDGIIDSLDPDDDNDGVPDVDDDLPFDPDESVDTDNDGIGNNADNDDDGDGVNDNADLFPLDPNESADDDVDGIGNNADRDDDNDGLADSADVDGNSEPEEYRDNFESNSGWSFNPDNDDTATTGRFEIANPSQTSSGIILQRGDTTSGSRALVTDGDAGSSVGANDIDNGKTSALSPAINVQSNAQIRFSYYLAHLNNANSDDYLRVSVRSASGTENLLDLRGASSDRAGAWATFSRSISQYDGQTIRILVEAADAGTPSLVEAAIDDLVVTGENAAEDDGDGIPASRDLDSDNDGLWDTRESGATDANNNALIDNLGNQGSITSPRDSDGDGIADYLDLESTNPANDGTNYDIARSGFASFDTNNDGRITSADTNGGTDADRDGIDDLIDGNPNGPGTTGGGGGGQVSVSIADISVSESAGTANVNVVLSGPSNAAVTLTAFTRDVSGSAVSGQDYYGRSEAISFAAGETSKVFAITIVNDAISESSETLQARLTNVTGASLGDGVATVTIQDDDSGGGSPSLSIGAASVNESSGTVTIPVSLSPASASVVTVTAFTQPTGSATQGVDFYGTTQNLSFAPGETSKNLVVQIVDDNASEADESIGLRINNASGAPVSSATATLIIVDDD